MKKPAANTLQVSDMDATFAFHESTFHKGCDAVVHRFDVAGGFACGADGYRDVCAHSFLQGTSAGRNLITVFSTVNNLSQLFFGVPSACSDATAMHLGHSASRNNDNGSTDANNDDAIASAGAACSTSGQILARQEQSLRTTRTNEIQQDANDIATGRADIRASSFSRRTNRIARKLRELFCAADTALKIGNTGNGKKKTRVVAGAGCLLDAKESRQWSSSSSSSA